MISVIIPTYNRGNTIKRSIESVLKQGKYIGEIIIVDDNSSDNTVDIIKQINDKRIKYIKNKKSCGACYSRNVGIENSQFDIIAFNDSDDEWINNKLEKQIKYILEQDYDVVTSGYTRILDNKSKYIGKNINDDEIFLELLKSNFIGTPTIVGRKGVFKNEKFDYDLPRFQDWELMIRIAKKYRVKFINEPLVNAYVQKNSLTKNNSNAVTALNIILNKHKENLNSISKSNLLRMIGVFSLSTDNIEYKCFEQAYNLDKNLKSTIDYYLSKKNLIWLLKRMHNI